MASIAEQIDQTLSSPSYKFFNEEMRKGRWLILSYDNQNAWYLCHFHVNENKRNNFYVGDTEDYKSGACGSCGEKPPKNLLVYFKLLLEGKNK